MNTRASRTLQKSQQPRFGKLPFRLSAIALALASISMLSSNPAFAADEKTVAELQAEVTRVSAENALLKQQLESSKTGGTAAQATAPATPADQAAEVSATAVPTKAAASKAEEPISLDAVVIHSRNRIERLQDVPISESVVTGKELERLGATDIGAITQRAGNVSWNYGNQRTSSLSIRGIGKQGQTEAQDPGVGLIVDGVSYAYNALSSSYDFTDVDTVEVARGPQGTLLGKNSSYGSVVVNSKRPSFTPSSDFSLTYGQLGTVKGSLAQGGAIVDDVLAWRGTFSASKAQGDLASKSNQDMTYTNTDRLTGRIQFLLTPSSDFNALVSFNVTPRAGEFTNQRTINTPTPGTYVNNQSTAGGSADIFGKLGRSWFTQNQGFNVNNYFNSGNILSLDARPLVTGSNGASAQLNWNRSGYTVTSITALENYYFDAVNDSGYPFDIYRNAGGFKNDYKQFSQELRLSSPTGGFVDYQSGLYYIHVRNLNDYQKAWGNDAGAFSANNTQYADLNANASGQALMINSLSGLTMHYNSPSGLQDIRNSSEAAYGQANWHFSDPLTLTTGVRVTQEHRDNTGSSSIVSNGNGAALNPVAVNGVQLGGFDTNGSGVLNATTNSAAQIAQANQVALQYFGAASYAALTAAQQKQVADAKAIRASAIGVLFNQSNAQAFGATQPSFVISPSYKLNEQLTTYVSLQYGQKSGVAQFTNGISNPVRAEKTTSYELGLKSSLLNGSLIFNSALFLMNIKDYQQSTSVLDSYTTALKADGSNYYTTATGNVPKVQAKGVEVDGVYSGIAYTSIRFSGAYNEAVYKDFKNSAVPVEMQYTGAPAYRDITGQTLPGASKWTGNVGLDYRRPTANNNVVHTSFNTVFRSRWNSDVALSQYAWVGGSAITDFSIGLGKSNQSFDASFVIKNLFNNGASLSQTWNTYTPAIPRWFGVVFSGKQ